MLYGWGLGYNGQLGVDNRYNHTDPQCVTFFKQQNIIKSACGAFHSIVLNDQGEVK